MPISNHRDSSPKLATVNELKSGKEMASLLERIEKQKIYIQHLESTLAKKCFCPACGTEQPLKK